MAERMESGFYSPRCADSVLISSVDDQHRVEKPKRKPPSRAGMGPTAGSFKPGVSGNPAGRPPKIAGAFAERVREKVSPDLVIDLALKVANDEKLDARERLTALWPLVDRGWTKPPAGLDLNVGGAQSSGEDWSRVPLDVRKAELERRRALLAKYASGAQPDGSADDNKPAEGDACPPRGEGETP